MHGGRAKARAGHTHLNRGSKSGAVGAVSEHGEGRHTHAAAAKAAVGASQGAEGLSVRAEAVLVVATEREGEVEVASVQVEAPPVAAIASQCRRANQQEQCC
eukprot:7314162-Prymnesium_polylepis.2